MNLPADPGAARLSSASAQHVVAAAGSTDPAAPLVVLLHGRGFNEREILRGSRRGPTSYDRAKSPMPDAELAIGRAALHVHVVDPASGYQLQARPAR